jgi:hypothetical protein
MLPIIGLFVGHFSATLVLALVIIVPLAYRFGRRDRCRQCDYLV